MVIYSNRNKTNRLIVDQVNLVLRDLFHLGKYWAEVNDNEPNLLGLWHPTQATLLNPDMCNPDFHLNFFMAESSQGFEN